MESQGFQPHFVLLPLMAQGHLIPMVDIAKLLAQKGVIITIITSPVNAARCKSTIVRAIESGLRIQLVELQFPTSEESGLPPGCEAMDMLPASAMHLWHEFLKVVNKLLEERVERLIEKLKPEPSCIISDFSITCAAKIADKFNIPRISFHGTGCFAILCMLIAQRNKSFLESITSDSDLFVLPGLPDEVKFKKSQLLQGLANKDITKFWNQAIEADVESFCAVVNSFEELEPTFVGEYSKLRGSKVWCVGPVSLCNKDYLDKAQRGNQAPIDQRQCSSWLDSQQPGSVIYACLGSLCNLPCSQLIELALALEASMRPFIWAIRGSEVLTEFENWIEAKGFQDRIKGRGILIRGWAPQVLILSHNAVGGFVTHCGWNSTIEGITAGVPMITWPTFAEQFLNEKLVVQFLRIGVRVGVNFPILPGQEEKKVGVFMSKEDVEKAIEMLMDEGEEGKSRRERARELAKVAKHAVEGGSSCLNIEMLIQDVMKQTEIMKKMKN